MKNHNSLPDEKCSCRQVRGSGIVAALFLQQVFTDVCKRGVQDGAGLFAKHGCIKGDHAEKYKLRW